MVSPVALLKYPDSFLEDEELLSVFGTFPLGDSVSSQSKEPVPVRWTGCYKFCVMDWYHDLEVFSYWSPGVCWY